MVKQCGILWTLFLAMQLHALPVLAQNLNDTLKEIHVTGKHNVSADTKINEFSPGQKVRTIDSAVLQQYQLQSMANMLAQQTPVFIKSYGFNGLATLNFRGASAAQSAVLWNGVPVQNAAMGIADVSTLPIMLMNKVNVVYGGSAALWGSGNVGGALLLEQEKPSFDSGGKTLSVSAGMGSYSQYLGGLRASLSGKRWYCSANLFAQTAANNFSFTNQAGMNETMSNDHLQSASGLLQLAYLLSTQNVISLSAWYQQYDRQVPPALFEASSDKTQKDGSLRLLASWNRQTEKNTWYAKSSLIKDEVRYRDDALQIASNNDVFQYYQEIGWSRQIHPHGQLLLFAPLQLSWMPQPGSNDSQRQNKVAIAGAYNIRLFNGRMNAAINAREEMTNGHATLLPGGDASFAIMHWLTVRANVQRTYRIPTLNELYYFPGGNTSLKPEQGWNEDAGYTVKLRKGRVALYHDLSVFNRDIHDWIIWLGGATWTPHNIAEVHSRGVETESNIVFKAGNWKFNAGINTSYVLATTITSYIYNDGSVGKQIPYAPRYNGQANIGANYKRLSVNYNHTYTGYRFITTDESAYLPPYQTGNVQLMYRASLGDHNLQLTGQCNNIWNQQYQVVGFRPLPGINWLIGCQLQII
jgi:vitamin B12 transporter